MDMLFFACRERVQTSLQSVWAYAASIQDRRMWVVATVVAIIAYKVLIYLVHYFGLWITGIGCILLLYAYVQHREAALRAAYASELWLREIIKNLFALVGDRTELVQAIKESTEALQKVVEEREALDAELISLRMQMEQERQELQEQLAHNQQESLEKMEALQVLLERIDAFCTIWSNSTHSVSYSDVAKDLLGQAKALIQGQTRSEEGLERVQEQLEELTVIGKETRQSIQSLVGLLQNSVVLPVETATAYLYHKV